MPSQPRRGLLTEQERQYLQGEAGNVSNPRKVRYHIRQRITAALDDFALMAPHLEERDYTQLFDTQTGEFGPDAQQSIHGTIAFLYNLALLNGVDPESVFWHGLHKGHDDLHRNRVADVTVTINSRAQASILESVPEKLETGDRLTDIELRALFSNPHEYFSATATLPEKGTEPTADSLSQEIQDLIRKREPGLEVVDSGGPDASRPVGLHPDLVLRDADGNLALIEILSTVTNPYDIQDSAEQLTEMAQEYEDTGEVRKLIITVPGADSPTEPSEEENGYLFEIDEDSTVLSSRPFAEKTEILDLFR